MAKVIRETRVCIDDEQGGGYVVFVRPIGGKDWKRVRGCETEDAAVTMARDLATRDGYVYTSGPVGSEVQ